MTSRPVSPYEGPRSEISVSGAEGEWGYVDELLEGKENLLVSAGFSVLSVTSASAALNLYNQGNEAAYLTALAAVGSVYAYGYFLNEHFSD